MKKLIVILLFAMLLTGCKGKDMTNQPLNTSGIVNAAQISEIQEEKGYKNILKIEIRKFAYSGEKTVPNRKPDKFVILEKAQDIKKAIDVFDSKVKNPGIVDRSASDYQMDIVNKDGSREVYDLNIGESTVVFFDNEGYFYEVRNADSARVMLQLMQILSKEPISEGEAISMIVKDYPDFPVNPSDIITKKLPTGGPQGTTANVRFTTKAEKVGESTYEVTITKDWGITVNGKYAKSFWKYEVTRSSISLLESVDNDYLPNIMK